MRIAGYIDHPHWKITILHMNGRYAIKFEDELFEQVYKFRDDPRLASSADVQALVDAAFLSDVADQFKQMRRSRHALWDRHKTDADPSFDRII